MNSAGKVHQNDVNFSLEIQAKIQNLVKELSKETESKEIDDAVERFMRRHKKVLIKLAGK
ncbi:hypothetical protein Calkr_0673 [Caldicellulosiruptor acetigenus I77R1B]|uniref:Uncharacterized protein n=1 Tax=Caldicellulosiruptor acetigenus (strain ATCC 700853 / DSM 12137 / I77R1B) TaxID=632335 RepID=E4SAD2_CALA7|nr:hypothetical protein [Caldicellulosiruptor acetigenus]ADQ40209.1 hypothetical protein Calkr_0673 [Caldicellulosiruptor acetigenus I77R1B]